MTTLVSLTNQLFPVGTFNSANIPAPGGMGLDFILSRTGRPAGRAGDGLMFTLSAWYSTDNGTTWVGPAQGAIPGGTVLDKNGNTLADDLFHMDWTNAQPTHLKFQLVVYVAFTAPSVTVNQA